MRALAYPHGTTRSSMSTTPRGCALQPPQRPPAWPPAGVRGCPHSCRTQNFSHSNRLAGPARFVPTSARSERARTFNAVEMTGLRPHPLGRRRDDPVQTSATQRGFRVSRAWYFNPGGRPSEERSNPRFHAARARVIHCMSRAALANNGGTTVHGENVPRDKEAV